MKEIINNKIFEYFCIALSKVIIEKIKKELKKNKSKKN